MAGLFDDRQKKKKETVQQKAQTKGSGNTASSSNNRQYGSFSDFFEARRQQEAVEDYKRWGKEAPARRAAIDGALRIAEQNRHKPSVPAATQNNTQQNNAPAGMPSLKELADAAVSEQRKTDLQNRLVQQGQKRLTDQRRREVAREGYHPNQVNIDPAKLAEFSKYSFENRTADENLKGYVAAEQENRKPKSAGFVNPISTNNTYNFGDTIRAKQTGAGGNVSRDGRRISSASVNYEESFKSAYAPQREAAIAAAQNDSNNPMNLANQFLERNAAEDVGYNARWKESAAYSQMTDDEKAVYNYVYSTYGPARAEEYKNGLMDELNARVGQDIYSNNIEGANTAEKALYSYGAGFMSGLEGVANAPAAFLGVENRQATDPEQLASSYLRSDEDNNRAQQILYDIASSTGNMTPGIIMSAAGVPSALSTVEFGAAQAGNAYNQALQNGNTASQSSAYAVQQFADEQLTNMLLNGVNAFGGGLVQRTIGAGPVGQAINRAIDKVAKTDTGRRLLRSIMRSIGNAAGEAQQEYLQFYTENFTQALLGMKDENGNVVQMNLNPADPEALYSAALGALNAFALNTPSDISRVIGGARADVSDARSIADSIAESTREDYSSDEAFEQAQELRAVSEEIARKQEAGVEVTAADRIAFNESMQDFIQAGLEQEIDEYGAEETAQEGSSPSVDELNDEVGSPFAIYDSQAERGTYLDPRMDQMAHDGFAAEDIDNDIDVDERLRQLAAESVTADEEVKRTQYNNIAEAARTGSDLEFVTNSATMLSDAEKTDAMLAGQQQANRDQMAELRREILNESSNRNEGRTAGMDGFLTGEGIQREGSQGRTAQQQRAAQIRTDAVNQKWGSKVKSSDIVQTGTSAEVTVLSDDYVRNNEDLNQIAEENRAAGIETTFIVGGMTVADRGYEFEVRGCESPDGKHIVVRADHDVWTAKQINDHERFHAEVKNDQSLLERARKKIVEKFSDEDLEKLTDAYVDAYGLIGMDAEDIFEEMCADAHAEMDVFGGLLNEYTPYVDEALSESNARQNVTRGPPAGAEQQKNSKEVLPSEKRSIAKKLERVNVALDTKDGSANPLPFRYSADTYNESMYVQDRDAAVTAISKSLGVSKEKAGEYIDDINSVAKLIVNDRGRYDYTNSGLSPFVSNAEYGGSFDFDTLCPKRRVFIGTFQAIQSALPNTALTRDEVLQIRKMMDDEGLEVPCGKCYVEGSRAAMGEFTKKFLELYEKYYPDNWQPNMAQANTPDGIEWIRLTHPECYEQYEYFWNHYGTLKPGDPNLFASQQKPKLYMAHSAYTDEILREFRDSTTVIEKNKNGGIRFQSFSDFEVIHAIDGMQAIMDMSVVGLAGQAYCKQPHFVTVFGDTGLKINVSIDAWGVDENGNLIFNNKEGMPFETAMELRDKHSDTVGTICCVYDDQMLLAALADDRIDFIIPFHRSQWKKSQYKAMGLPSTTKDYTYQQNEKWLDPSKHMHEYKTKNTSRMVRTKCLNYMPNEYWDFSKTGKENAETYLEMCYRDGKRPKFYKFLDKTVVDGKAKYSLKEDGSTDGYWKLLIDFKMYNNDGVGVPQQPVKPIFDMDEIHKMFKEYAGEHHSYPVAQGIVDRFVSEYKEKHPRTKYSSELVSSRNIESAADDKANKNVIRQGSDKDVKYSSELFSKNVNDKLKVNMGTFFSGSGTVDFALRNIVNHEFAVEYDAKIAAVYRANNGDNIYVDDVRNVDIDPHKGKVEYFHASPVCKSYSNANNDQGEKPLDIETARATADAISELQPKVVTVENVARYKNSEAIKLIEDALKENGYEYDKNVYRASDFGGATIRERMFLRAVKDGVLPEIDTSEYEPMSWYEAVEDLIPDLPDAELKGYMKDRLEVSGIDPDNLKQPVFILGGEKSGKLTWASADEPAPTILAKSTEAKILMPDGRVLRATPRVMARIQGLPDSFDLQDSKGGMTNAYRVVGNGVPTQLTQGIVGPLLEENLIKQKSEKTGISYSSELAPTFYSKLQREVEGFKGNKIGAASVESYLKGKGVKDEEIKWSGIRTFLEGKKSVGKQELMDYLKANELQIETKVLSSNSNETYYTYDDSDGMDSFTREQAEADAARWVDELGYSSYELRDTAYGMDVVFFDADGNEVETESLRFDNENGDTHWSGYRLKFGENYREILFKIPGSNYSNRMMNAHWNEEGVLAHARVQDFETKDGNKVLFVDEIQSDWHNAGQKYGYWNGSEEERANYINSARDDANKAARSVVREYDKFDRIALKVQDEIYRSNPDDWQWPMQRVSDALTESNADTKRVMSLLSDEERAFVERFNKENSYINEKNAEAKKYEEMPQDAPFRNNYTNFVLKDLLRMAAEGNYDYLAWTTGKMQEERWSDEFAEGYRIEYDQEIPSFLKKYGKQWKAGLSEITINDDNKSVVPAITVNDAMKQSVLYEGQPMYSSELAPNAEALERSAQTLHQLRNMRTIEEVKARNDRLAALDREFDDNLTNVKGANISRHQIYQIADEYTKDFTTKKDRDEVRHDIAELYDLLGNTTKTNARQMTEVAVSIADKILEKSAKNVQTQEQRELNEELKRTKFWISPKLKKEIAHLFGSYSTFKRQYGKYMGMTLHKEEATSIVDSWYTEKAGIGNEDDMRGVMRGWFPMDIDNEADRLLQIADVAKAVAIGDPVEEFSDDYDEIVYTIGQEILAKYFKANGNDKYMQKLNKVKQEMREEYEAKLDYIASKYNDQLAKNNEKVAKEQAKFLAYKEEQRNKKFDRAQRDKLWNRIRTLRKMKGGPQFEAEKAAIFDEISAVRRGALSKRTIDNLTALKIETDNADKLSANFSVRHHKLALKAIQELDLKHVGKMNAEEIATYLKAVTELITYQRNENRMLDESKGRYVSAKGRTGIQQQNTVKGIDYTKKASKWFNTYMLNSLAPTRALPMLDGYLPGGIFGESADKFFDGEMRTEKYRMEAEKMFSEWLEDEKYMSDITKEKVKLKNHNGQTIEVSKDIALAWYLAGFDDGNLMHTETGGWLVPNEKLYNSGDFANAYNEPTRFVMNLGDYKQLESLLSDRDKAFAKAAQEYFDVYSREHMDEVAMKLYGYTLSKSGHYLPIIADKDIIPSDIDVYVDPTLENSGFTKARKDSAIPIRADALTKILQRSINNVSRYYGMTIPLRDFNSVMNYTAYDNPYADDRQLRSLKGTFKSTWGTTGENYVSNLVSDLNRGGREKQKDLLDYIYMGYGSAVLGANVRVMLSQASSYPMALTILHPDSLAKGLATRNKKVDMDYIDSITPSMYMRRKGMTGTQLGEMYGTRQKLRDNKAFAPVLKSLDVLTSGIQRVDVWTTTHLVSACEAEIEKYYPSLKKGTKAYDNKLAELIEQVNSRTQPSYSTMNRNEFSKRAGTGYKILTMFKTQTFNMYGEFADAVGRDLAYRQLAKKGVISQAEARNAGKAVGTAAVAVLLSQLLFEAIKKAVNLGLYHEPGDDRNEETGEVSLINSVVNVLKDTAKDIISMPPGGNIVAEQIAPTIMGFIREGETVYDIDAPGLSTVNDVLQQINYLSKSTLAYREDKTPENRIKVQKNIAKLLMKLSQFGYPLQNTYNTLNGIYLNFLYGTDFTQLPNDDNKIKRWLQDTFGKDSLFGLRDKGPSKKQYANMGLNELMQGNEDEAFKILEQSGGNQVKAAMGAKDQDGVVEYLQGADLTDESKRKLWELAGYKDSTYDKKMGSSEAPTRGMPTRGGYISEGDVYSADTSLKGRLKLAWEMLTDDNMAPDMRLKAIVAALTNSYATPDISEFDMPEYVNSFHREPSKKQRKVTGEATVKKGDEPIFWDVDAFNFIMENWSPEITAPYWEMYENGYSPSPEEVKALIEAHPEQDQFKPMPVGNTGNAAAVAAVRQKIDDVDTAEEKVKIAYDYITDKLGLNISYNTLNEMSEMGLPADYIKAMFDLLPEDEQRTYVTTTWPYELLTEYYDSNFNLSDTDFKKMVKENWNKVEGDKALRRLAMSTVRSR